MLGLSSERLLVPLVAALVVPGPERLPGATTTVRTTAWPKMLPRTPTSMPPSNVASARRSETPGLARMRTTWCSTVLPEVCSCSPISL